LVPRSSQRVNQGKSNRKQQQQRQPPGIQKKPKAATMPRGGGGPCVEEESADDDCSRLLLLLGAGGSTAEQAQAEQAASSSSSRADDEEDDDDDEDDDAPLINLLYRRQRHEEEATTATTTTEDDDERRRRTLLKRRRAPSTSSSSSSSATSTTNVEDENESAPPTTVVVGGVGEANNNVATTTTVPLTLPPPSVVSGEMEELLLDDDDEYEYDFRKYLLLRGNGGGGNGSSSSAANEFGGCLVCGACLKHIVTFKGRVEHAKRCSKRYAVAAKDVVCCDDENDGDGDDFVDDGNDDDVAAESTSADNYGENTSNGQSVSLSTSSTAPQTCTNPYLRRKPNNNGWHEGAAVDLSYPPPAAAAAPGDRADESSSCTSRTAPPAAAAAAPLHSALMAGARRLAKTETIRRQQHNKKRQQQQQPPPLFSTSSSGERQRGGGPGGGGGKRRRGGGGGWHQQQQQRHGPCPAFKKIPGTDIVVDGFRYASSASTRNFFLTHFHADHYGGLTKGWEAGTIYCSLPTAALVAAQLGVDRKYLHPIPLDVPVVVASLGKPVTVTLVDANHCPGAVMVLFQIGQRQHRRVLHVGDFRWDRTRMLRQPALRPFFSGEQRLDEIYLDTTYCDPRYDFPTQQAAVDAIVDTAVREVEQAQRAGLRLLLVFGAYTIGKEQVYWSVADRLQVSKVHVDSRRRGTARALVDGGCWTRERLERLTTRASESSLWVVPMSHITLSKLPEYLNPRLFDRVVGFRPTGWSLNKNKIVTTTRARGHDDTVKIHSVPYSEHSSFTELVDCLRCLGPARIVPTVAVSKSQEQIQLLRSHLRQETLLQFQSTLNVANQCS